MSIVASKSPKWRALALAVVLLVSFGRPAKAQSGVVRPGNTWLDTTGHPIQAHGGGMIKVQNTYYWFGEDKTNGSAFQNVKCYASTDLTTWTFVNNVLTLQSSGDLGPNRVVERPKVIFNSSTNTYVMYMHIDSSSYSEAKVGVATSPSVCGAYSYRGSFQPLGFQSRDLGLFQDTDGAGYVLTEDRVNGLRIDKLSSDYLSVSSAVALFPDMEAPAMIKVGGTYFMFCSHLTGWNPNDNEYATASSISGPWTTLTDFAPSGTNTFSSQTNYVLPVSGTSGTTYVYMGDRWVPSALGTSTYIWLPLTISGSHVSTLTWYNQWSINTAAGTWSTIPINGIPVGMPVQIINQHSGLCLDVAGAATTNGAQIDQWTCNGQSNQNWTLTSLGNSDYELQAQNSGLVLDVAASSTADGAKVDQWQWNGGNNQRWFFTSAGNGYYTVHPVHSSKCLDVAGQSTTAGAKVDQWTCNGGSNQLWRFQ
jgi:hypothetical protein